MQMAKKYDLRGDLVRAAHPEVFPAVLVSYCPRCGAKCECPGLAGIKCRCGATHDRVKEVGDE